MLVSWRREGGFAFVPGRSQPSTVDTSQLDAAVAEQLESCIVQSGFFDLPLEPVPPPVGGADLQTYTITVQDEARTHTVVLRDPVPPGPLGRLVTLLSEIGPT